MLSKNNRQYQQQRQAQRVPHYGLRKLSVGVASVLLSTTLYMGVTAQADTNSVSTGTPTNSEATNTSSTTQNKATTTTESENTNPTTGDKTPTTTEHENTAPTAENTNSIPATTDSAVNPASTTNTTQVEADNKNSAINDQTGTNKTADQSATTSTTDTTTSRTQVDAVNTAVNSDNMSSANGATTVPNTEPENSNPENEATTKQTADFTWTIHWKDRSNQTTILPDTVINVQYQRDVNSDRTKATNWEEVPNSIKVTGTQVNITSKLERRNEIVTDSKTNQPVSLDRFRLDMIVPQVPEKHPSDTKTITYQPEIGRLIMDNMVHTDPNALFYQNGKGGESTINFDEIETTEEKQTRTLTLHYQYGDMSGDKAGSAVQPDAKVEVYYKRLVKTNLTTNQKTVDPWQWDKEQGDKETPGYHVVSGKWTNLPQNWAGVTADVPNVTGYMADLDTNDPKNANHVPANKWVHPTFTGDDGNSTPYLDTSSIYEAMPTHTIVYNLATVTNNVKVVDDDRDGTQIYRAGGDLQGKYGEEIALTDPRVQKLLPTTEDGYYLTPGQASTITLGSDNNTITLHVKHTIKKATLQMPVMHHLYLGVIAPDQGAGGGDYKTDIDVLYDFFGSVGLVPVGSITPDDLQPDKPLKGYWNTVAMLSIPVEYDAVTDKLVKIDSTNMNPTVNVDLQAELAKLPTDWTTLSANYATIEFNSRSITPLNDPTQDLNRYLSQLSPEANPNDTTNYESVNLQGYWSLKASDYLVDYSFNGPGSTDDFLKKAKLASTMLAENGIKRGTDTELNLKETHPITFKLNLNELMDRKVTADPNNDTTVTLVSYSGAESYYPIGSVLAFQLYNAKDPVTRTIKIVKPDGTTDTIRQTAQLGELFRRKKIKTGPAWGDYHYAYSPLSDFVITNGWNKVDVPTIAGYTPSQNKVDAVAVDKDTKDQTITITYAKQTVVPINYVDTDNHNQVVQTGELSGLPGQTVTVNLTVPTGYRLANGEQDRLKSGYQITDASDQSLQIKLVHDTQDYQQSKNVTRTITITNPDGTKHDQVQTATVTQEVTEDLVTHKITPVKTTATGEWTAVEIPAIHGYTPSQTVVAAETVTPTTENQTIEINYAPNKQQRLVQYVDDAGHVIHTTTLTGVTDQTVAVPNEVPTNWKLVNPSSLPSEIELSASGNQPIVVTIKHQVLTVQPDQAKTPADHLPDGSAYPGGMDKDSLNKTVTRTIKVTAPDHTINTVTQTAKLHRTATIDLVTKTVTYGDWSTDQWNQYKAPTIAGYTTTPTVIAAQPVTKDTENQTITVNYQAQEQSITVQYKGPNGQVVKTEKLTGYTDQPLTITPDVPNGYELVPGQKLTYTPNNTKDQSVVIQLKHALSTTQETQPVTRTIKITKPNGQQQTIKQTVTLHRTVTVDQVTHEKTYSNWSTAQWNAYQVPVIAGYTPSQNTVAAATVTAPDQSTTVDIDYQANDHTTTIKYVDSTGKVVHTTTVHGHTDQTVKVPNETPAGWKVENDSLPNELHFGANGHVAVTVTVQHRTVTVQSDQPVPNGTPLPNNPAQHYHGVEEKDLNKTITRTIKVTNPAGQTTTTTQKVLLHRSATIDEVTGEVTYDDWSTGQLTAFVPPVVDGYTPNLPEIASQAVKAESKDQTITITYAANPQTAKIQYKDKTGTILHEQIVHGKTGETVKVPSEVPAGWKLVNGQQVPTNITFGPKSPEPVTVTVEHATVTVSADQPKTTKDPLPDDPTKNYPSGVGVNDLNQTLTRTITIKAPGQAPQTITQPAHLMRSATVDEVTGEVTYSDWSTDEWPAVTVPSVPGYTPNIANISAQTVTDETKPTTITVNYAPNEHTTQLQYVDEKGAVIKTVPLHGVTGETVTVPKNLPAGWILTPTTNLPETITMTANGHPAVIVTVQHGKVTVIPDKPKTTADPLPDNPYNHYPTGVGETDLNKTLTRTINFTVPGQKARTITQTVTIHRSATVDEVTGKVTYNSWSTAKWPEVNVPNVLGYTPNTKTIPAQTVTDKIKNTTVTVNYTADEHTTQLQYVDEKGNVVETLTLQGRTGETATVPTKLPAGWVLTPTTKLPETITMTANGHPKVVVTVQHGKVTVTPDHPKTTADPLPDNPNSHYPTGVGETDLNKTLTRTINLTVPGQKARTITQTVTVHRSATVDEVTGEVTYSSWSTAEWPEVNVPSVQGYTPNQEKVPAEVAQADRGDQTVTIAYHKDSVPNKTEKQTSTVKPKTVEPTKPMPATETTAEKNHSETKSMPTKATNTASTTLPQTGDAKNAATWLGVINMLFTGLVGWWTKKKHKPQA